MEPIAIIGLGCRFPGAQTPRDFWRLLRDGVDGIKEVPPERWDIDAFFDPDPDAPAKMSTRWGGFVDEVDRFDADFFGMSPREAERLDPQHRLVLEVVWEALENAAIAADRLAGSATGVFIGLSHCDYHSIVFADRARINPYNGTGVYTAIAANRVSYLLDLRGPSLVVDTACSSSLTAVHLACESLRTGESQLALAGGVNLVLTPDETIGLCKARMMAADGRCKTFDAAADGYVRGEGCGVVVLKLLAHALRDADNIVAVIRGSALNQDGMSNGITAPNGPAQQKVIRQALSNAGVQPAHISYLEAHGTGTSLGDPIEVKSLKAVLLEGRSSAQPCWLGSVKANIGHLEAAAGIAGLIKVALSLQHREIPPHLHLKKLNPYISLDRTPFAIPATCIPWPAAQATPRLAGISSFGFGGTNCHVIVEEAPAVPCEDGNGAASAAPERRCHLLTLRAKSAPALRELAQTYAALLEAPANLADVCYTANTSRAALAHRLAAVAASTEEMRQQLSAFAADRATPALASGKVVGKKRPKIAFLFTGQGSQAAGMGRELYDSMPVFHEAIDRCAEILRDALPKPLQELLYPVTDAGLLDQTACTQPALFALEYALAELWKSWGVQPAVVIGHSVGEYVAACVAGVFSLEDGLALIAARARLMQSLPVAGRMIAVSASEQVVANVLEPFRAELAIAAVNGPASVVLSGADAAAEEAVQHLQGMGIRCQRLRVSHAFHSPLMEPMLQEFAGTAAAVRYAPPRIPLVANLTGDIATQDLVCRADYWRRHVRGTVRFMAGMQRLHEQRCDAYVEIGPGSTLLALGRQCIPDDTQLWLPSLAMERGDRQILHSLAALYARGCDVDWHSFDRAYPRHKVALPTYPFQRERHWYDHEQTSTTAAAPGGLLGEGLHSADRVIFETPLGDKRLAYLKDHKVYGAEIFPAAGYIELAVAGVAELFAADAMVVEDVHFEMPLRFVASGQRLQLILLPGEAGHAVFEIMSCTADDRNSHPRTWQRHARGHACGSVPGAAGPSLDDARAACREMVAAADCYQQLAAHGLDYGPAFRGIVELWRGHGQALSRIVATESQADSAYHLPPVLLDGGFQTIAAALADVNRREAFIPISLARAEIRRRFGGSVFCHARLHEQTSTEVTADLTFYDVSGGQLAHFTGLLLRRASRKTWSPTSTTNVNDWLYELQWQRQAPARDAAKSAPGIWLILGEQAPGETCLGVALKRRLEADGHEVVLRHAGDIAPLRPEDFRQLVSEAAKSTKPLLGAVHLWSLQADGAALEAAQELVTASTLHLVQALVTESNADIKPRLFLATRQAQAIRANDVVAVHQTPIWGLAQVVGLEHPELKCVSIDLDESPDVTAQAEALLIEMAASENEPQVAWRGGERHVARLVRTVVKAQADDRMLVPDGPHQLAINRRGLLENLELQPVEERQPDAGEVRIQVCASGVNFRDVLNALGLYPGDAGPLGGECAGIITAVGPGVQGWQAGDAVVGFAAGALASTVLTDARLIARKPAHLSFAQAATLPIAFATVCLALQRAAGLQSGEKVLIHAAAGGVGLAAVQWAQRVGAQIYATASPGKWEFLRTQGVVELYNSRTLDFAGEISERTGGRGVDVVLNSLADEFIPKSLAVLARGGRFVEIGKRGIWSAERVAKVRPDAAYHVIALDRMLVEDTATVGDVLRDLMQHVETGDLRPLPISNHPLAQARRALRTMQQARHIGKIVVSPAAKISSAASYLITGGLGGLGMQLAGWLVAQGARHLLLLSRHAPSHEARSKIAEWQHAGAQVITVLADVARVDQLEQALVQLGSLPPLRGVFHAAGALDDGVLLQQSWARFQTVFAAKVYGAWNLHRLTLNQQLDYFVLFSSTASLLGSPGQGNYAAGSAFLDGLAHYRRGLGLPALSINWGPWDDVGMAARQDGRQWAATGLSRMAPGDALDLLRWCLVQDFGQVGVVPIDWDMFFRYIGRDNKLLAELQSRLPAVPSANGLLDSLQAATPGERLSLLTEFLQRQLARVLGLDASRLPDQHTGFMELGMDSLLAVELRNRVQRELGLEGVLPATLMFDYPTIDALAGFLAEKLHFAKPSTPAVIAPDETSAAEPIAIVGMGCRFPGQRSADPDSFWQALRDGVDAISEVPPQRWHTDAWYDPDPEAPGKMYTRGGGFLEQVDCFDAGFFGIAPREAVSMDPQQRLLLETTWEALENAAIATDGLAGSASGVFIGICSSDYMQLLMQYGEAAIDAYAGTGNTHSVAAGRLAYVLGLQGPALAIDTACSSSLVAVHSACQSLRNGECRMALAGGVNVILAPQVSVNFCKARMLSADGRCKTFDAAADGYGRGEGCGMVVLKRLADAHADGDRVLAVIRGSAINQDGRSSGLTAPNGPSQQAVIRQALANAGIKPAAVSYIEAHGTGTSLGDPIEVQALAQVFADGHDREKPLWIGSVKTNIGHLEGAAGIAGLIKTVLAMRNEALPGHLHLHKPNPLIAWNELPVAVPQALMPWPRGETPRIAGVSSFGFSGTNAHVVIEEAPDLNPSEAAPEFPQPLHLLCVSAKSEQALTELASAYAQHLQAQPTQNLVDIAATANLGRAHLDNRLAVIAASVAEAQASLARAARGDSDPRVVRGKRQAARPKLAFLFTGQGSQYVDMGQALFATQPTFRHALEQCDRVLRSHLERPLLEVLYPPLEGEGRMRDGDSPLDQTLYTQPALFALQYALARLWLSWGVRPDLLLGHSVGEYAAACIAGIFTLDDALALLTQRARLMQQTAAGAMAAVFAPAEAIQPLLNPSLEVAIAAVNGPENTVVSGSKQAIDALLQQLQVHKLRGQLLQVSHGFHSALMEPMLEAFARAAHRVTYRSPQLRLQPTAGGTAEEMAGAAYWVRQVRRPVHFAAGMQKLHEQGCRGYLEIGPAPTLLALGRRCVPQDEQLWLPSLRPGKDWQTMLHSLGTLYVHGGDVDFKSLAADHAHRKLTLPTYSFQRERHWPRPSTNGVQPCAARTTGQHPLLGQRLNSALKQVIFASGLDLERTPFLADHRVHGLPILPFTAYLEMGLAAGRQVFATAAGVTVADIVIEAPLLLSEAQSTSVQLIVTMDRADEALFKIYRCIAGNGVDAEWQSHASGKIQRGAAAGRPSADLHALRRRCVEEVDVGDYYQKLRERGLEYGPAFKGIGEMWRGDHEALGRIQLPPGLAGEAADYEVHPALLDAALQLFGAALSDHSATYLPVALERLEPPSDPGRVAWAHVQLRPGGAENILIGDVRLLGDAGDVLLQLGGLRLQRTGKAALRRTPPLADWLYEIQWQTQAVEIASAGDAGAWLVFADRGGIGARLAGLLEQAGHSCVLVHAETITPAQKVVTPARSANEGHPSLTPWGNDQASCRADKVIEQTEIVIDPAERTAYAKVLASVSGGPPLRGIVHLWALDSAVDANAPASTIASEQSAGVGSVLRLVQALAERPLVSAPRLLIVTRGTQSASAEPQALTAAPMWGLGRVISLEHPELKCVLMDLDAPLERDAEHIVRELEGGGRENQVVIRRGVRQVARLLHSRRIDVDKDIKADVGQPRRLHIARPGVLDDLELSAAERVWPGRGEVEIQVVATGLNFRDVLCALGMYPDKAFPLGGECAGVITKVGEGVTEFRLGDEVLALALGSLSTFVTVNAALVAAKPARLSFTEAATIPIAFLTAHHGLHELGGMSRGTRVLIHAAAGGVGMAAVQLAQKAGAEVFATASPGKWAVLRALGVKHVMNSRTLDFAAQVMEASEGRGVDIVLNSLAGEFIPKSLSVLAAGGRFLEIGKRDIWGQERVTRFKKDVRFTAFDLAEITRTEPFRIQELLRKLLESFSTGDLKPLPQEIFAIEDAARAFKFMAQAKHVGKIVITQGAAASTPVHDSGTYLVTGAFGALGLQVARWLVDKGARHLLLIGRSQPADHANSVLDDLRQRGVQLVVARADVANSEQLAHVFADLADTMPPLAGVIHAAGVLEDALLVRSEWESFARVLAPKVRGAWNLHLLTRNRPLDFFVLFSSASSVLGSPGQGNYAAANAFLDALADYRRAGGLPALSINWGPWSTGMAADQDRFAQQGLGAIEPAQGLLVLEKLLGGTRRPETAQLVVLPVDWRVFRSRFQRNAAPPLLTDVLGGLEPAGVNAAADCGSFRLKLQECPETRRRALLAAHVREQVGKVLMLDPKALDIHKGLTEMGMDSLMAVELRNRLQNSLECTLPATLAFESPTIAALIDSLAKEVLFLNSEIPQPAISADQPETDVALDDLSQDEMADLLAEKLRALEQPPPV